MSALLHAFTSPKPDPADGTLVRPSNWNAPHKGAMPVFNVVTDYGADPTGVADATTATQNALNAAGISGIAYLPEGSYRWNGTVTMKSLYSLHGAGRGRTTVRYYGAATCLANDAILTDYLALRGITFINAGTGTIGLDLSHSRHGQFEDLSVQSFTTNISLGAVVGIACYFNAFRSVQTAFGTNGLVLGGAAGANANFFDMCESINDVNAIVVTSATGCRIRSFHTEGSTNAITITAGNDNEIDAYVEAFTNAGSAAAATTYNILHLYLDGAGTAFVDSGWNTVVQSGSIDGIRRDGPGVILDKRDTGLFGPLALKDLFSITVPTNGAYRVTVAEAGFVTGVNNYAEVGSWDLTNQGGVGVVAALVARNGAAQLSVAVAGAVATFRVAGHAAFTARYQYTVHVVGIGQDAATGLTLRPTYTRL